MPLTARSVFIIVPPSVSKEDAAEMFPEVQTLPMPSGKEYLRITPQPK